MGEIIDEHDVEEADRVVMQSDGSAIADARTTIEELEGLFGTVVADEQRDEADTLAGLIFGVAGRIARPGEIIRHASGLEFEILDADARRLKSVRIRPPAA